MIAYHAMQPAVRYRKADCLDLPSVVTEERTAPLSKDQRKAFDEMRNHLVLEAQAGVHITAVNAADKINKLRQILCGSIKQPDGSYIPIDHEPRLKLLVECIQEASAKVLVIVPFKGILQQLQLELAPHLFLMQGATSAILNGDVSPKERNQIISEFKHNENPRVLLCHPKVMAHGLNLTEADMCIFYAPIYSNDEFLQVVERFNRPGQTRKMTVIRMGAADVRLEWQIYDALDGKQTMQTAILNLYQGMLDGTVSTIVQ